MPLKGAELHFYNILDTSQIVLDKIITNDAGEAELEIGKDTELLTDSEGYLTFLTIYKSSALAKTAEKKISVKRLNMELSFYQKDTTKFISVEVHELSEDKELIPLEDLPVLFYVKGTFSLLNFGEESTNSEGRVDVIFSVDMPDDTSGILTIVSKLEEDENYGTVEAGGKINWGIPVPLIKEKHRGLGDSDAPLWMVYTLIFLLSAVWFHYFYVIYLIIKIKLTNKHHTFTAAH